MRLPTGPFPGRNLPWASSASPIAFAIRRVCFYSSSPDKNVMMQISRDYDDALQLLSQLQSNKTITSLFTDVPKDKHGKDDLNALAIPEMTAWLARAGYTPLDLSRLRCVHVAGTKGKGSVTTMIASILAAHPSRAAGRVGTYTSPHLASVRERIAIDGRPLSRDLFTKYFYEVWDRLTQAAVDTGAVVSDADGGVDGPATKPFYFRFLTLVAFHAFLREGVTSAVVECGIGGEYDSTNVLPPEAVTAAVITQLGIDHVFMLGDTVEKIAWHKAGILKPGAKGLTRLLPPASRGVMQVLRDRAEERETELVEIPDERVDEWSGVPDARLQGPFQKFNMALAAAAAREHLLRLGVPIQGDFGAAGFPLAAMPSYFVAGLRTASIRGRSEIFHDKDSVEWFLDGAHTADSMEGVGEWFATRAGGQDAFRVLVFNQQDRNAPALLLSLLKNLSGQFHAAVFTRNEETAPKDGEPSRDLDVQKSCAEAMKEFDGTHATVQNAVSSTVEAVRQLTAKARQEGKTCKVLVTGSLHLIGPVIRNLDNVEY